MTRRARKRSSKSGRFSFGRFTDPHLTVEDLIAEDDEVVARNSVFRDQQGEYMGRTPTGKSVTYSEIFILRFANGRIAESAGLVDVLSQVRQLGMIPASSGSRGG